MESTKVARNKGSRNRDATIIQFTFNAFLFKNLHKKYLAVTIKILSCMKVCTSKESLAYRKWQKYFLESSNNVISRKVLLLFTVI